jgi:putative transposase
LWIQLDDFIESPECLGIFPEMHECQTLVKPCICEFGAHRRDENGNWDSEFKQYLETQGIRPILARVKHPQTNGKIEKWFDAYKQFRKEFSSLDEFIDWYNNRPHGSLDFESLESPELAFWRRLPQEAILGLGFRTFSW